MEKARPRRPEAVLDSGESCRETRLEIHPRLGADGDAEKVRIDAALTNPRELVVVGELHIGANQGIGCAEANAAADLQAFEHTRGVLSGVAGEERKDSAVAAGWLPELVVDG